jgi:hypothetical protein
MADLRQSAPPKFLQPRDTGVGRLLAQLADQYPEARRVLSALHALPATLPVGLRPDKGGPTNFLGTYNPRTEEILVSRYLDEPGARQVMMHEASHATDQHFKAPTKIPTASGAMVPLNAQALVDWHKQTVPGVVTGDPEEALADYRAAHALGLLSASRLTAAQRETPQQTSWARGSPIWPITKGGIVDDAYMQAVLGRDALDAIRAGTYRAP